MELENQIKIKIKAFEEMRDENITDAIAELKSSNRNVKHSIYLLQLAEDYNNLINSFKDTLKRAE